MERRTPETRGVYMPVPPHDCRDVGFCSVCDNYHVAYAEGRNALFNLMLGWRPDEHSCGCPCDPCDLVRHVADVLNAHRVKLQALEDAEQIIRDGDDSGASKG